LQGVRDGKFAEAYALLTADAKEKISQENFIMWQELSREIVELRDFKITQVKQGTNFAISER